MTRLPSGTMEMIVVDPSTWQKASRFWELSKVPRTVATTGSVACLTS